jgi:hypothetical protein
MKVNTKLLEFLWPIRGLWLFGQIALSGPITELPLREKVTASPPYVNLDE